MTGSSSRTRQVTRSFKSRQFAVWMAAFLAVFVPAVFAAELFQLDPAIALTAGLALSIPLDEICDRLTDSYVQEVPDGGE